MQKLHHHVHNFFIPHEGNDHYPHSVRHKSLLTYGALLVAAKVFLVISLFIAFPSIAQFSTITQNRIAELVNQARASEGLTTLTVSPVLQHAAQLKLNDMFENNYFAHESPSGDPPWKWFKESGYVYTYAGENLAMNFVEAEEVHEAWMASPTHRANIVNSNYREIGVAAGVGKINGEEVTLVVQMFGTTFVPPTLPKQPLVPTVKGEEVEVSQPVPEPQPVTETVAPQVTEPITVPTPVVEPETPAPVPVVEQPSPETAAQEIPTEIAEPQPSAPEPATIEEPRFKPGSLAQHTPQETPTIPVSETQQVTDSVNPTQQQGYIDEQADVQEVTFAVEQHKTFPEFLISLYSFVKKFFLFILMFVVLVLLIKVSVNIRIQHRKAIIYSLLIILLGLLLLALRFHFLEAVSGPVIIN